MTADGSLTKPSGAGEATLATRLAEKISAFRVEDITERALTEARTAIIDTIACTLSGIPEPCAQILMRTPGVAEAPGRSSRWASS
jgi:2-methylcitrate dehydratase PrpD